LSNVFIKEVTVLNQSLLEIAGFFYYVE